MGDYAPYKKEVDFPGGASGKETACQSCETVRDLREKVWGITGLSPPGRQTWVREPILGS